MKTSFNVCAGEEVPAEKVKIHFATLEDSGSVRYYDEGFFVYAASISPSPSRNSVGSLCYFFYTKHHNTLYDIQ
jgi:hypothetical protein